MTRLLCALLCVLLVPAATGAEPVYETLTNGLEIAMFPDESDDEVVQIWLRIHAGSVAETNDQRGAAIVLKRASSLGTSAMDEPTLEALFASVGFDNSLGQGAFTHFDQTTTMLGSSNHATTVQILRYYRDLLDGHQINQDTFTRAQSAVRMIRTSGPLNNQEIWLPKLLKGTTLGDRLPMPDAETIDLLALDAVNAFANEHYTPTNATVIVVGNFDPDQMRSAITKALSGIGLPRKDPQNQPPAAQSIRGRSALSTNTRDPRSEIALIWFEPSAFHTLSPDQGPRRLIQETIASELVRHRINAQIRRAMPDVQETDGSIVSMDSTLRAGQLVAAIDSDEWEETLRLLLGELNRLASDPIGAEEFTRARRASLLKWQADQNQWSTRSSAEKASILNWVVGSGLVIDPASWSDRAASILGTITNNEIHAALRRVFEPANFNTLIIAKPDAPVTIEQLRSAIDTHRSTKLKPLASDWISSSVPPIIASIPFGGSIEEISQHGASSIWTAQLSNGVTVRCRPMPAEKAAINITLHRTLDDRVLENAGIAGWLVPSTTKLSPSDIRGILTQFDMSIDVVQTDRFVQIVIRAPSVHLQRAIELASVLLSDPEVDERAFSEWKTETNHDREHSEMDMLDDAIQAYAQAACQACEPAEKLSRDSITINQAIAALHEFTRTAPIEIAIAGGSDAEVILEKATSFFGALAARPHPALISPVAPSEQPIAPEGVLRRTTSEQAHSGTVVGLVACSSTELMQVRAMILAGMLLNEQLGELSEQGKVAHGGSVRVYFDDSIAGRALLLAEVKGGQTEQVGDQLELLLANFARTPVSQGQLDTHTGFIKNALDKQMLSTLFWANRLSTLSAQGYTIDDIWLIRQSYLGFTPESLQKAFAHSYDTGRHIHIETTFDD